MLGEFSDQRGNRNSLARKRTAGREIYVPPLFPSALMRGFEVPGRVSPLMRGLARSRIRSLGARGVQLEGPGRAGPLPG